MGDGAGQGIGRAVASAPQAAVAVTAPTREDFDLLASELGGDTLVLPASVDDPEQVEECA